METKSPPPSLLNKMSSFLTNKPFKKVYRLSLLMILLVIFNNTSNQNNGDTNYDTITGMITGAIKQSICPDGGNDIYSTVPDNNITTTTTIISK